MVRALHRAPRLAAAVREVVPRRQAQRLLQLRRPARRGGERVEGRLPLGRRARRRPADDHVLRPPARGRPARERAEDDRRREGDAGRDLHGHGPRAADRDARLRADRRAPHRRLRRLLRGVARRPAERHGLRGPDHPGRGVAQGLAGAAEAERRRGARRLTRREAVDRPPPHRQRSPDAGRPRRVVARPRRRRERGRGFVSVRADGLGGSPLPALHERHHREAEGHRAHHRRLPRRRVVDAPLHLRRQARLGVLVRRRRRLGDRPQLHRLRAALQRDDRRHVRGRAGLPRPRPVVGDRRALRRGHPLHRADGDPLPHEVGPRARATSTTSRRSGCWGRWASRSTPRRGSGTAK